MRDVERVVLDVEVAVALPAVRSIGDSDAGPGVLAMTRSALLRVNRGTRLGKAGLQEAKDRVAIVGSIVAALTSVVRDGAIAKIDFDVSRLPIEPVRGDRLQLLPDAARRFLVTGGACDRRVARIHRSGCEQMRLPRLM
jgi:hypothetical protein